MQAERSSDRPNKVVEGSDLPADRVGYGRQHRQWVAPGPGNRGLHLEVDHLALARPRCHPPLDLPLLALSQRPRLRGQSGGGPRPVRPSSRESLWRPTTTSSLPTRRHPGSLPVSPDPPGGRLPSHQGRARVRAGRRPACLDVHWAKLFGRCESRTGIEPFNRLVAQVMTTEPCVSATCVWCVVDNGSSHQGQVSIKRLGRYRRRRPPPVAPDLLPGACLLAEPERSTTRSSTVRFSSPTTSWISQRSSLTAGFEYVGELMGQTTKGYVSTCDRQEESPLQFVE